MYIYRIAETKKWIEKLIQYNECGTIISAPEAGVTRTLIEVFRELGKDDELEIIDLTTYPSNINKFIKLITKKVKEAIVNDRKFLLINDLCVSEKSAIKKLKLLNKLRDEYKRKFNWIFGMHEDLGLIKASKVKENILDNVLYFPYSNENEFVELTEQNNERYKLDKGNISVKKLYELSGGCPYLLKKLYGQRDDGDLNEWGKYVLSGFKKYQIRQLQIIKSLDKVELGFFEKIGMVKDRSIVSQILKKSLGDMSGYERLNINNGKILVGKLYINNKITVYEKEILIKLKESTSLTRQEVANICYGNKDDYSDCALDKIISRLRQTLESLGVNKNVIKTIKGVGYRFDNKYVS